MVDGVELSLNTVVKLDDGTTSKLVSVGPNVFDPPLVNAVPTHYQVDDFKSVNYTALITYILASMKE